MNLIVAEWNPRCSYTKELEKWAKGERSLTEEEAKEKEMSRLNGLRTKLGREGKKLEEKDRLRFNELLKWKRHKFNLTIESRKDKTAEFTELNRVSVNKLTIEQFRRKELLRKQYYRWRDKRYEHMIEQRKEKTKEKREKRKEEIIVEKMAKALRQNKDTKHIVKEIRKKLKGEKNRIISEMRYKNYLILLDCLVFNTWKGHTEEYFKKIKSSAGFAEEYNFQTPEISGMEIDFSGLEIMQDMTGWDAGFKINR